MHPTSAFRRPRLVWGLVLAAGLTAPLASGQAPPPPAGAPVGTAKLDRSGALIVPLGGSVQFDPGSGKLITDVFNRNEDYLTVRPDPANPKVVVMTGRAPGLSQVTLTFEDRTRAVYDVVVQPDLEYLNSVIRRAVPTSNVEVQPGVGNVIILSGYVTSPEDADIIARITGSLLGGTANNVVNAIKVGGVQQVQIDVVVASVDRSEIRSRGFDFFQNGRTVQFASVVSGLISQPIGSNAITDFISQDANLAFQVVPSQFFGALRALRVEGLAKFLAEPKVVTQSGRPAFFLSGGRQAVLGPAAGINGPGVVYEPVGTQLEVLPIVYGNGKIWLDINPSVRAVNNGLGIVTAFGTSPGFTEQNARTSVMLESGQTFAIGGLIQNSVQATASRVPVLGDLPYIGTAFSRVDHEERETELVILVTPRLVEPMDCNQVPRRLPGRETRTPDDYELFLEGVLEAPRGQRKVWNGKCYNAPYKCDPTFNTFPCAGNVCTGPDCIGASPNGVNCAHGDAKLVIPAGVPVAAPAAVPAPPAGGSYGTPAPAKPVGPPAAAGAMAEPPAVVIPAAPGKMGVEAPPVVLELPAAPTAIAQPVGVPAPAAPVVEPVPANLPPAALPAVPGAGN